MQGKDQYLNTIGVVGAGAWGTALANVAARAGRDVILWARESDVVDAVNDRHENVTFLPGVKLEKGVRATGDLSSMQKADALLMVPPAQHMRKIAAAVAPYIQDGAPAIICAKGIEQTTGFLMSEVLDEILPDVPIAVLSGPTFAREAAIGLPTAVTLAATSERIATDFVDAIGQPTFRPYLSSDLVGAQIGGAVKNVLAIASGIVVGRKLGENARAALITRGLAEILRFGRYKGAETETMMGLCGLGDLLLTCGSEQSRNMSVGIALGEGKSIDEIMGNRTSVAEGVHTADILAQIARDAGLDVPICAAVDQILHHGVSVDRAIEDLLNRPFTIEG